MKCNCNTNCIKSKQVTLEDIDEYYKPCDDCDTRGLKKAMPLSRQVKLDKIDSDFKRCPSCNKRHIDYVMANILKILNDDGLVSKKTSIRNIATPLITPAIVLENPPYLSSNSLVIITEYSNKDNASKLIENIPELKAVIKGDIDKTVGQLDEKTDVYEYELLAGCDIRADIQNTPMGDICIYKPQSRIHVEYPKTVSQKIVDVDKTLEKYDNPTVLDAFAATGLLGIYALLKNAKSVHFNDINSVATDSIKTNLEVNNLGNKDYEVTTMPIDKLVESTDKSFDIAFLDAFPSIDTKEYVEILKKIANEVVII